MGLRSSPAPDSPRPNLVLPAILGLLCAGIVAAGYLYYDAQRHSIRAQIASQLSAVAHLKVQQIESWLGERTADAALLAADPMVQAPASVQSRHQVQNWLESFREHCGYTEVSILNGGGAVLNSAAEYALPNDGATVQLAVRTARAGIAAMSDLHNVAYSAVIDFLAPVRTPGGAPTGAVVLLRADASGFLRDLVQAWPGESPSAEALLVRREGDRVVYLNELRFPDGAKSRFTLPPGPDLPAALDAQGRQGIHYGFDYRGVAVVAALAQVPGTPWALVVKVDAEEVFAPLRQRSHTVGLIVGLLLAGCLTTFGLST